MSKPVELDIATADELQEAVYCAVASVVYHAVSQVAGGCVVDVPALCEEASSAARQAIDDALVDCGDFTWLDAKPIPGSDYVIADRAVRQDEQDATAA
jgi:hypothetical protein